MSLDWQGSVIVTSRTEVSVASQISRENKNECEQEWTTYIQIFFFFLPLPQVFQHYAVSTQNLSTFYSAEIVRDVGEWRTCHNYFVLSFRPRPHVSGDFCIRNFFYADTPSVHTCPPCTLGVSGDFCIRSPEWKFLYTLCIPDTCGRSYPYIFVYADVTVSEPVFFRMHCWLILWDVRIRIGYVWTVVYDSYTLRVDADIFVSA